MNENNEIQNTPNCVTGIFNYIKSGPGITILALIFTAFGYAYMSGYNEYFNVSMSFYELNIFNDFFSLILASLILSIPILFTSIISIFLFYLISYFDNIKKNWKRANTIFFICFIIFMVIASFIWYKNICNLYEINNNMVFKTFRVGVESSLVFSIIVACFNKFIRKYFNDDIIDLIFILIIVISLFLISYNSIKNFGKEVAGNKRTFMIVDDKYVALYNTDSYAVVTTYEISDSNQGIFYNCNLFKIDLTDKNISHKTFNKNIIFKCNDYCITI